MYVKSMIFHLDPFALLLTITLSNCVMVGGNLARNIALQGMSLTQVNT